MECKKRKQRETAAALASYKQLYTSFLLLLLLSQLPLFPPSSVTGLALFHAPVAAQRTLGGEEIEAAVRAPGAAAEAEAGAAEPPFAAGTERKSPREDE